MKALLLAPNISDVLSLYRAAGPFQRLRKQYPGEFDYEMATGVNWANISACDIVFLQRPFKSEHQEVIKICKEWNVPIVVDYDDHLLDIKTDNPVWQMYQDKSVQESIKYCTEKADMVFVSTKHLGKCIGRKDAVVVPNAYDSELFSYVKPKQRTKMVVWRGSATHTTDVLAVKEAFEQLIEKHKDWKFVFISAYPWWMYKRFSNVSFVNSMQPLTYMKAIYDMAPAIMVHPLSDCDFNRSKSMCSWLEATHAGAAFVGPDFEEFQRPGVVTYDPNSQKDFFKKIDGLITNPEQIPDLHAKSYYSVMSEFELKTVNKTRFEAFKRLLTERI